CLSYCVALFFGPNYSFLVPLPSFPTRRSSDLTSSAPLAKEPDWKQACSVRRIGRQSASPSPVAGSLSWVVTGVASFLGGDRCGGHWAMQVWGMQWRGPMRETRAMRVHHAAAAGF